MQAKTPSNQTDARSEVSLLFFKHIPFICGILKAFTAKNFMVGLAFFEKLQLFILVNSLLTALLTKI